MKKLFLILIISTTTVFAQLDQYPRPGEGEFTGGLGLNWIDGELHYRISLRPEVSFANFGAGLDLNLDFDSKGKIRKENFNEFSDYLSIIRYVRYGMKRDPLYARLGALDYHTIGHGTIMYRYNNSPSFDSRKIGLVLDIDFGNFGFESIYGAFGQAGIVGARGYLRPLKYTSAANVPVISNLEVGATIVSDLNENSGIVSGYYDPFTYKKVNVTDAGSLTIIGFDIGLPVIRSSLAEVLLYFDVNKIIDFGTGVAAGVKVDLNGLGIVSASAKLERRFNGKQYFPAYFNSLYEIERFRIDKSGLALTKAGLLAKATDQSDGFYGELGVNVLGLFDILGSYQRLDKFPQSGILHLWTQISPEDAPFLLRAGYDKINIRDEKDLFKLDDRSYLFFEMGYKPVSYLLVSMVYHWTFTPLRDGDDNIIGFEPQKRIEPRVSFIFPFNL